MHRRNGTTPAMVATASARRPGRPRAQLPRDRSIQVYVDQATKQAFDQLSKPQSKVFLGRVRRLMQRELQRLGLLPAESNGSLRG